MAAGAVVSDSCGLLQPVERHVQHQRADHTALRGSLLGRGEDPVLDHPGLQPSARSCPWRGTIRARRAAGHDQFCRTPPTGRRLGSTPAWARAFQRGEQRGDRVGTATARPEPIRLGFEPGLPFGFQRVTDPCLVAPVGQHGNADRAAFSIGLRHVHAPNRHRVPGGDRAGAPAPPSPPWLSRTAPPAHRLRRSDAQRCAASLAAR